MTEFLPEGILVKDKISWVMDSILQAVREEFQINGVELPERQFLTFGELPPHDCEQLTVTLIQSYIGPPGDQAAGPQHCDGPRSGVFQVELVRCVADGAAENLRNKKLGPDLTKITNYAHERAVDVWLLLDSSKRLSDYNQVIADATVGAVQGQFQGVIANFVVQI